jgi:protein SCO1/2
MNKTILIAVVGGIAALLLGIWSATQLISEQPVVNTSTYSAATVLPQPRMMPPFLLVDQDGQVLEVADLEGHWTIVFMGFTSCGHVCPMVMAKLRAIKDAVQSPVEVLFVSVDPERDTSEKILSYVRGFDASFTGATGAPEEIAKFANALGAPYFVDSSADPYIVDHSSALFIVDPAGAFAAVFTAPHEIEPIAADLDELLSKN